MRCTSVDCKLETTQRDIRSRGVVLDGEKLCRAGFDPNHYQKNGAVKRSLISNGQLIAGEISVWRVRSTPSNAELAAVVRKLTPPAENTVKELLITTAAVIRSLELPHHVGHRFCVLDECSTDRTGGFDPDHAHVSFCREVDLKAEQPDSAEFQDLKTQLLFAFTSGDSWKPAPPGENARSVTN